MFLGGQVETVDTSGSLRLLLRPGAHVWLTQSSTPSYPPWGIAGPSDQDKRSQCFPWYP